MKIQMWWKPPYLALKKYLSCSFSLVFRDAFSRSKWCLIQPEHKKHEKTYMRFMTLNRSKEQVANYSFESQREREGEREREREREGEGEGKLFIVVMSPNICMVRHGQWVPKFLVQFFPTWLKISLLSSTQYLVATGQFQNSILNISFKTFYILQENTFLY